MNKPLSRRGIIIAVIGVCVLIATPIFGIKLWYQRNQAALMERMKAVPVPEGLEVADYQVESFPGDALPGGQINNCTYTSDPAEMAQRVDQTLTAAGYHLSSSAHGSQSDYVNDLGYHVSISLSDSGETRQGILHRYCKFYYSEEAVN